MQSTSLGGRQQNDWMITEKVNPKRKEKWPMKPKREENRREIEEVNEDFLVPEEDEPILMVSLEAMDEATEKLRKELDMQGIDTAHTDGSTTDPHQAQAQGLVYNPPSDPPVLPSDDLQGAQIAAGFASSIEGSNPDQLDLPERVDNQDLDLEEDVRKSLRNNSETGHLTDVKVAVRNGVVFLAGTVFSQDDIGIVQYFVRDLDGVRDVRNNLQVAES